MSPGSIFFTRCPAKCAARLPLNSPACSSPADFSFLSIPQLGDRTGFDGLLEAFPRNFHEPYFGDFLRDDLSAIFAQAGLRPTSVESFSLSKRIVCEKRFQRVLVPDLPAVAQKLVGEHAGHHRLPDRHGANADARIVPALGRDLPVSSP